MTRVATWLGIVLLASTACLAQLNETCTATIQNRSVQVSPDGTFAIPNVLSDIGFYKVRVTCKNPDGTTAGAVSEYLTLSSQYETKIQTIAFGSVTLAPISIQLSAPSASITAAGQTVQLTVTGTLPDSSTTNLSTQALGTLYVSSNPKIATVSGDGLVTGVGRGQVIITARNEGVAATLPLSVRIPVSTVGDGIPDSWKLAHGFSVTDPGVASADPDNDGLTNLQEYKIGTDPNNPDTDGDGLQDGQEMKLGTNPLNPDTDGDGLPDGQEVLLGTNPLNPDTDGDGIPDGIEVKLGLNPLVPDPTTIVQGRVLNGSNKPVAGASVVLFGLITGVTDSTGFFSIRYVPADLGSITAIARVTINNVILEGESGPTTPTGSLTNVGVIQLGQSNGSISGVVTNLQNSPVANVQVTINIGGESRTTSSNASGLYAFSGFAPNSFVVSAVDPVTSLSGQASGFLFAKSSAAANIQLSASGAIKGTVFATDGTTPVANASVVLSGASLATTITDETGRFSFGFVPVGAFTLDATDASANHGRSAGSIRKTGAILQSDVTFLGKGSVSGVVTDGSQNLVPNAAVSLSSKSIFGGVSTATTDATGNYVLSNIFVGPFNVAASSSVLQLGGQASGTIASDRQNVTANITLTASGTVTGTIFHADGVTSVANAQVSLSDGSTTQADVNGVYTLSFVPIGTFTISVTDPSNGDQGTANVTISSQGDVQMVNVSLNGQGNVTVTVLDALGNTDASAILTLTGQTPFGGTFNGVTQTNGAFTFSQVPAGAFAVTASDPVTQAGAGPVSGSVTAGGTAAITLQLQPVGNVTGFVFSANGVTPVAGITVNLIGGTTQTTTSGSDGSFLFSVVPSGTYTLQAVDGTGAVRAQATVTVATAGSAVTQNLILVGFGTVAGKVTLAEGGTAVNASVTVTDASGTTQTGLTDSNGQYVLSQVAVGTFTVAALLEEPTQVESGFAQGQITADGFTAAVNILLVGQSQFLPATLYDGNGLAYRISFDGSVNPGSSQEFNCVGIPFAAGCSVSTFLQGALRLDVVSSSRVLHFLGDYKAITASNGRELDIQQLGISGLNVTRKIFVPVDGYYARYLEVLQNPSGSPITVGLRFTTDLRFTFGTSLFGSFFVPPALVTTSSGDNVLDVTSPTNPDRWVVLQDTGSGVSGLVSFETLRPVARVFDGSGAALQATTAQWTLDNTNHYGALQEEFDNITVPAGGQVALLHFLSPEVDLTGAIASAKRLIQLSPEGIVGISPTDLPTIQNFVMPANGVSTIAPLESLAGHVFGQVLAGDNVTPIPNARVSFQSNDPLFASVLFATADANGNYDFTGQFNNLGSSMLIPVAGFIVQATDPASQLQSKSTVGSFINGNTTAQQDIVISGGSLGGTVFDGNGQPVALGMVSTVGHSSVSIGTNGSYLFADLAGGTYTLTATIPTNQGPPLIGVASATVVQGQKTTVNISVQAAGVVSGIVFSVSGVPFPNLPVQLQTNAGDYQTSTDAGGNFSFTDVIAGSAALVAYDPVSQSGAGIQITVLPNQTVSQNLMLVQGTGTVTGIVTESGLPVAGAQVTVTSGTGGGGIAAAAAVLKNAGANITSGSGTTVTTGTDGSYSVTGVSVGPFTVTAIDPVTSANGQAQGFVALPGTTATVNVTVQTSGSWNLRPHEPGSAADEVLMGRGFKFPEFNLGMGSEWRWDPAAIGRAQTAKWTDDVHDSGF